MHATTCVHLQEQVAGHKASRGRVDADSRWRTQAAAQGPIDEDSQRRLLDFRLRTDEMFPDEANQPSFEAAWALLQVARSRPCPCACLPQASCHRRCALALAMQENHLNLNSAFDAFCQHRDEVI